MRGRCTASAGFLLSPEQQPIDGPTLMALPARDLLELPKPAASASGLVAGVSSSRELLLQLTSLGLPTALEFRETITPQFFADLLAFSRVNAQSETLAELVSGLSMPVGLYANKSGGATDDAPRAAAALAQAGEAKLSAIVREGGFAEVRRATEGPFNMVLEAR